MVLGIKAVWHVQTSVIMCISFFITKKAAAESELVNAYEEAASVEMKEDLEH